MDHEHPALRAQAAIRQALETGTGDFGVYGQSPVTFAELIADFAAIGGRVLAYASPTELGALLPADIVGNHIQDLEIPGDEKSARVTAESPVSATALAAAATWLALAPPTTRGAADRLRWLIESNRKHGIAVRASSLGWGRGVSAVVRGVQLAALEPFLVPSDQLRYRIADDVPTAPFDNPIVNRLPALAWMRWSLPLGCAGVGYSELRAALSAAIALVGTRAHLSDITADLGATTTVRGVLRVLQRLHSSSRWPETRSTLNAYANYLCKNPPPIDYQRRRSLSCSSLLPDKKWADLCLRLGIDAGRGPRLRLVRSWLFERLTTLPADRSPWSTDSAAFRSSLSAMALWMTAELVESLDQHALEFLQDRGIHGEPVVWRPPTDVAAQGGLPGLEVESLHRWIGAQKPRSFAKLSEQFGFDADVARAVLDERPVASHWFGPATESISTAAGARVPTRRQFEILYTERRWGLARIASHTGLSRRSVTELAYVHGIAIRPPGRPTRLKEN